MASAATRGANRTQRDQVIEPEGDEKGQAPAFLDGLMTGEFPTIKGRGRPSTPLAADLVSELETSLDGKHFAQRTYAGKEVQNQKNRIKAWGKKHSPALAFDFVTVHTDEATERVTIAMRAKVAPAE